MITAVDTNILIDILDADSPFYSQSVELIDRQNSIGSLIISPIVFSELLVFFLRKHRLHHARSEMEEFLSSFNIEVLHLAEQDYALAAEVWLQFLNPRQAVVCPRCGVANSFSCRECHSQIFWRTRILPDFLIGAHAQNHADVLLTRDRGYYRKYFSVKVLP